MKEKVNDLYFAKCRHCITNMLMNYYEQDKMILPRPDYVDYFTILLNKDAKFYDIFSPNSKSLKLSKNSTNLEETYDSDLIISLEPLADYVSDYEKLNTNQCKLAYSIITKARKLTKEYGYKKR